MERYIILTKCDGMRLMFEVVDLESDTIILSTDSREHADMKCLYFNENYKDISAGYGGSPMMTTGGA